MTNVLHRGFVDLEMWKHGSARPTAVGNAKEIVRSRSRAVHEAEHEARSVTESHASGEAIGTMTSTSVASGDFSATGESAGLVMQAPAQLFGPNQSGAQALPGAAHGKLRRKQLPRLVRNVEQLVRHEPCRHRDERPRRDRRLRPQSRHLAERGRVGDLCDAVRKLADTDVQSRRAAAPTGWRNPKPWSSRMPRQSPQPTSAAHAHGGSRANLQVCVLPPGDAADLPQGGRRTQRLPVPCRRGRRADRRSARYDSQTDTC